MTSDILIVDDTVENIRLLSKLLKDEGYQVRGAADGKTALMLCDKKPPSLILLDIMMPGMNGYDVCRHLKEQPETKDIPVIFLSALNELTDKITAFRAGGVDYISKPFEALEVLARVATHSRIVTLQRTLMEKNAQLKALAETDSLTGLFNRRYLISQVNHRPVPYSLILFDIDDFKQINDQYGHQFGDEVLICLSNVVMEQCREQDIAARWGGEEFLIYLPNTHLKQAKQIAETLRVNINQCCCNQARSISASFGIASQTQGESLELLIKMADSALYRSKLKGKNCVELA
ncbi:diguanylate cyclase [Motilimonas eburnea]|uniref:diguanylate cyclase n=1 Tax=Motilimonas eburnea TaxID=1737488 RepID=UPI001E5051AA|nr:diguanylate cyclase [Motilimonas eburnea]MCE2570186.1 diguanylate cyclase [Motilimonas eburnea]